jgi:hypothetical protein
LNGLQSNLPGSGAGRRRAAGTGFTEKVTDWLARCPDDILSFYLGTGRPPQYQMQIAERLIIADKARFEFISFPRLIHGVCYSVPPHRISRVLSRWDSDKPADFAVGDAWVAQ